MYGDIAPQLFAAGSDDDPALVIIGQGNDFVFPPPEEEFDVVDEFEDVNSVYSLEDTSNFFTVEPDIYQDWRYMIADPISNDLFVVTNLETYPTTTALAVVNQLVFEGDLIKICDAWIHKMATTLHGPGGMKTAVIRALSMLGIMSQLHLLDEVRISTNFSFPESVVRELSAKQLVRLLSLTFKMEIVRVPYVMEKLRVISNEENLTDDDILRFIELLGDIGATHRMPWFMNLWPSY